LAGREEGRKGGREGDREVRRSGVEEWREGVGRMGAERGQSDAMEMGNMIGGEEG
jgi:hypothetical protein